jgi:DNA-binding response OmpR family regulator
MPQRVLVVEDEPNIVESLSFLVRQAGYNILIARDGLAAIRTMEDHIPDLILLDVMLPRMDGYDVCRSIRADKRLSHIPIIMLSAKGKDLDRRKGLELGANEYLTKPFSTREVVSMLKTYLGEAGSSS